MGSELTRTMHENADSCIRAAEPPCCTETSLSPLRISIQGAALVGHASARCKPHVAWFNCIVYTAHGQLRRGLCVNATQTDEPGPQIQSVTEAVAAKPRANEATDISLAVSVRQSACVLVSDPCRDLCARMETQLAADVFHVQRGGRRRDV